MKIDLSFFSLTRYRFEALLFLKVVLSLVLLVWLNPTLFPDEAQYWVWSNHLDWGYYSKPPGIAWMHAFVSLFLPKEQWAVRLPSLLMSALAAWHLSRCMLSLGASSWSARYSTGLFLFSPLVLYGSFAATTDVGLLLGWCAILNYLEKPLLSNYKNSFWLVFWAFFGLLFKPTIALLALASWFRYSDFERKQKALLLLCGSLLGAFFPFMWNLQHDSVTFRHVSTQLFGVGTGSSISFWSSINFKRPFELFFIQMILFSPLVSLKLMQSVKTIWRKPLFEMSDRLRWHMCLALGILAFTVLGSFRVKFQANWSLVAFPSFFCLLALNDQSYSKKWARAHLFFHASLFVSLLFISAAQANQWSFAEKFPKEMNLFKSVEGWSTLSSKLPQTTWDENKGFWIGDKYQTCSLLSFYGPSLNVYWFNIHGARKNQFSLWSIDAQFLGGPARFISVEAGTEKEMNAMAKVCIERLKPYFTSVSSVKIIPLWVYRGQVQRSALIIDLEGYKGGRPQDPDKY